MLVFFLVKSELLAEMFEFFFSHDVIIELSLIKLYVKFYKLNFIENLELWKAFRQKNEQNISLSTDE